MKKRNCKLITIVLLAMFLLGATVTAYGSPESQALVAEGRAYLFNNGEPTTSGLITAKARFAAAVEADATDQEANLFFAITRLPGLLDNTVSYTSGYPIENVKELMDRCGVSHEGRDILDWSASIPEDAEGNPLLPSDTPSGQAIQDFFRSVIIPEIDGALANLSVIAESFNLTLTASETGEDRNIEVDYGDVLLYRSFLHTVKAWFLIICSYDIDMDIDDIVEKMNSDLFNINTDLLDAYPGLLQLLADGSITIGDAREAILAAIEGYDAASTFIREETDDQWDDLIMLDPEDEAEELEFRTNLEEIKNSLENGGPIEISEDSTSVDLREFFDDPISIRYYMPSFNYDPYTGEYKGVSSFPDKTFSGILPDGLPPGIDFASVNGYMVTSDLWIRAVINTEEKGPIEAVWQKGGEDTTSRGDTVIWGHFYASPSDVTWGSSNNPDLFVKIWFDVSGRVDVNYFHVSVPEIEVFSDYPYDGMADEHGTTTMNRRYIRQYYENGQSHSDENYEDGNPPSGYSPTGNPSGYSTINDLRIGSIINTVGKGPIDAVWRFGGQDTTSRGDQVVWGHFYANPSDVTWGSQDNPDLFVKIWFDVSGRVDVNYFHVSVPDIEVYSDLPDDGTYDQKGTTIMDNRYIRHEYWR